MAMGWSCCGAAVTEESRGLMLAEPQKEPCYTFKVVLLGENGVGKSSLAYRFIHDSFYEGVDITIGAAFLKKTVPLTEDLDCELQVWDTAGEEKFRSIGPIYTRGASAVVIVYDVSNKKDFDRIKHWFDQCLNHRGDNLPPFFLLGNKIDLLKPGDPDPKEVLSLLSSCPSPFFHLVSAKNGTGVKEVVDEIAQKSNEFVNGVLPKKNIKKAHH